MTRRPLVVATAVVALAALPTSACSGDPRPDDGRRTTVLTGAAEEGRTSTGSVSAPPLRGGALHAPPPARSAGQLAVRLVAAERVSRDPAADRRVAAQAGFEAQALYRLLARRGDWQRPVVAAVPRSLRATVRLHVRARREFRAMHVRLSSTLPAWRIVPPAPERRLLSHYREAERRFGVPWEVLAAVNLVETGLGRIRGVSVAGARGPMQFLPATWRAYGRGDIDDPHDAIMAAARYLAHNGGGRGHVDRALYAYNHSTHYVRGVQAYADVLRADAAAFRGLYDWQVLYLSSRGDVWLPEGYASRRPVPVASYLRRHPDRVLSRAPR